MTRHRFEAISSGLRLSDDRANTGDPWYPVRGFVEAFNARRQAVLTPGDMLVVDESMVAWKGIEQKYHHLGVPHKTKIPRKPVSQGVELKAIADGDTGILMGIEIVEGKERQRRKAFAADLGEGTALTLRLASPFKSTGRTVVADSAFASVKTLIQLERLFGLYFMGM